MTSSSPKPPYQQVADDIRAKIKSGELKPKEQIPSNRTLAEQYGVAPMTASKAIRALCDEGWTISVPSLGVFVSETVPAEGDTSSLARQIADLDKRLRAVEAKLADSN
ncbi:GntR family transcriptional regulator [Nocardia nova]|uniref:GntR family transcriptional regulator n=2 Tax=Nocardia TaxID=1817 RepID=UPI000CEA630A|nr:GntR family transcriptional regulator [Nocardia nova]